MVSSLGTMNPMLHHKGFVLAYSYIRHQYPTRYSYFFLSRYYINPIIQSIL